jgi:hypothetical protein
LARFYGEGLQSRERCVENLLLALVVKDLANGFVSVERANKGYGVVVRVVDDDLGEYEVDVDALQGAASHRI